MSTQKTKLGKVCKITNVNVNQCYSILMFDPKIFLINMNFQRVILLSSGDSRSMRRYIGGNDHRARLSGALRAWYIGHAGGHRVARDGRWWVVTSARTQRTVALASIPPHAYARLVLVTASRSENTVMQPCYAHFTCLPWIKSKLIYWNAHNKWTHFINKSVLKSLIAQFIVTIRSCIYETWLRYISHSTNLFISHLTFILHPYIFHPLLLNF